MTEKKEWTQARNRATLLLSIAYSLIDLGLTAEAQSVFGHAGDAFFSAAGFAKNPDNYYVAMVSAENAYEKAGPDRESDVRKIRNIMENT